jgi:BlaI family transcriptional regulator, penicillinase repressor
MATACSHNRLHVVAIYRALGRKMARKRSELPALSQSQRQIMEIVWNRGEVSASVVRHILAEKRKLARNTVRTLLERMEQKGWLKHREEGRTYFYSAAQPREATIGQKVLEVVDSICGGSPEELVTALLDYRGLSEPELRRIRQMLDDAKANQVSSRRS